MTVEYINTGIIANDGTGDDLREAFTKINDNFEELDLRIVEATVIENNGSLGEGIYTGIVDGIHGLKRINAGANISLSATENSITVSATDALDQLIAISDNGTLTVAKGQTMSVRGGEVISTRVDGQQLFIDLDSTGVVARDTAPQLAGTLNANNFNILGANTITATTVNAYIEGLVYGYDVREFGPYLSGFDFGTMRRTYNNALEFILATIDLDFGAITPESGETVDLGFIV
jgi:hypothetical protein